MTSKVYWWKYCVHSDDDDVLEFNSSCDLSEDGEFLAKQAAEDYHSKHDGWESSWPIPFTIWDNSGKLIGKYTVERDVEPVFYAYKIKSKA